ncbi:MAG TPA: DNA polymerase III subunit alpha [Flavobacteriales bacterium]|nr:DNA polymerase III subunit alpha [Flavobacteriales bacterium]
MYLIFDTETTGLPKNYNAPITDLDNWPRMVQIAWQLHELDGTLVEVKNYIVKPEGYTIPFNSAKIHGITTEKAEAEGLELKFVLEEFKKAMDQASFLAGHNIEFDINIAGAESVRTEMEHSILDIPSVDTKDESTEYCAIPGGRGGRFKWPTLTELHMKLFGEGFDEAHNASADVVATARCFLELIRLGVIKASTLGFNAEEMARFKEVNPSVVQGIDITIEAQTKASKTKKKSKDGGEEDLAKTPVSKIKSPFIHLHNHTQFSVLQSTTKVKPLVEKAKADGMPAVCMTDHGNLYGAFKFVRECIMNDITPIVGCELYVAQDRSIKKFTKDNPDRRNTQVLLAKNRAGYNNLVKLCSAGFTEGYYAGYPRVDKEILVHYKENLIATTGGIGAEIPSLILNVGETQAEEAFQWWHEQFGVDFYVELVDHGLEEEKHLNEVLLQFAKKYGVKYFPANNSYYLEKDNAEAHDILLCVKDGELKDTPIGRGRGFRYGMPNDEYYFKTQEEMKALFAHLPESFETFDEILSKVEVYDLKRDILLPSYELPEGFTDQDEYLRHLTYEGAKNRYPEMTDEIRDRLDLELKVVKEMGFPGYFLIVQDFTSKAREMGVSVGPGRGSPAGSAVAFCVGITNIDPIKYKLLFERFLNPERVSMPDIDIDFDDEGRGKIIDYVVDKYGKEQVAQIITYGSMAAKSAIRDVSRVMAFPLDETDRIAKLVPDFQNLEYLLHADAKGLSQKLNSDAAANATQLQKFLNDGGRAADILEQAEILEGSVRNTGIHACGVIITPENLTNLIPVATSKDSDLLVTQFDNKVVEDAGMLKMDFLGLKTLTIIKHAIRIIKSRHGVEIDIDDIPLDDEATFELYQKGETNGTFQFESVGMQKNLRKLKPTNIEDLIAMNALFRPGPMQFIDTFIARKHGREPVEYPHAELEGILKDTYGIMVYQEQIMQTAQILGGYSLGGADLLRRAMGKKKMDVMEQQKEVFREGCAKKHQIEAEQADKIFDIMAKFAEYGFNRSHSAAYSVVAFQTAYLKANYPAEYMASVLTNNMSDIKKVSFFMEECRRADLKVLGPDINESEYGFTVNKKGEIRFGLGAVKGVGEAAVESLVAERIENGLFEGIFDLTKRMDHRAANKKTLESMAYAGALDAFTDGHRAVYFHKDGDTTTFLEKAIRFGQNHQHAENSSQVSLFGEGSEVSIPEPQIPEAETWGTLKKLSHEKELVGMFISGHPLDDYALELKSFTTSGFNLGYLDNFEALVNKDLRFGAIVTHAEHRTSKKGKPYGELTLEDYRANFNFRLFSDDYLKWKAFLTTNFLLYITGRVVKREWGNESYVFKVQQMELLSELMDKKVKELSVSFDVNAIDEGLLDRLDLELKAAAGGCRVKLNLIDFEENLSSELISKEIRVRPSSELVSDLEKLGPLEVKLI